jgi:hypothetical protein
MQIVSNKFKFVYRLALDTYGPSALRLLEMVDWFDYVIHRKPPEHLVFLLPYLIED